jgi:hypothetical protein
MITHVILVRQENGSVSLGVPTEEVLQKYTIEKVALKDVPAGLPFWIVPQESVPTDHEFFNAWEIDEEVLGPPHGHGSEFSTFEEILGENNDQD